MVKFALNHMVKFALNHMVSQFGYLDSFNTFTVTYGCFIIPLHVPNVANTFFFCRFSKAAFCMEELIISNPHNHLFYQKYAEVNYLKIIQKLCRIRSAY